jgi:lipid-binding SYLF domain-containing protein
MRRVLLAAGVLAVSAAAQAAITPSQTTRLAEAAQVVRDVNESIPAEYWNRAHCVSVIPNLKKEAFIVGGEYGKGVMSCRAGDRWSAPMFIQLAKGSWGFQVRAEEIDVVLLVMNEQGVQKLLENRVTLGADASIAAGPIGRQGKVGTDASLTAEILSYSHAKGLFAGIDLSGGVLRPDADANTDVYGTRSAPRTILATREISAPTQAHAFLSALNSQSAPTAADRGSAGGATPAADTRPGSSGRPTTVPTTDDDLRARVVDIQQLLDRILADTTPNPVGTAGSTAPPVNSGTVTVDRVRLLQMREQLDALLAAMNRR